MRKIIGMLGVKGAGKDTCAQFLTQEAGFLRVGFADALYQEVAQAFNVSTEFLGKRETKETDLPELALEHCANKEFVEAVLAKLTSSKKLRQATLAYAKTGKFSQGTSRRTVKALLKAARSPRWTLQMWGTEYRRQSRFGVDAYWLDKVRHIIEESPTQSVVVTDVRFLNEFRFIEKIGGVCIRVRRLSLEEKEAKARLANGSAAHSSETELLSKPTHYEVFNEEGKPESLRQQIHAVLESLNQKAA